MENAAAQANMRLEARLAGNRSSHKPDSRRARKARRAVVQAGVVLMNMRGELHTSRTAAQDQARRWELSRSAVAAIPVAASRPGQAESATSSESTDDGVSDGGFAEQLEQIGRWATRQKVGQRKPVIPVCSALQQHKVTMQGRADVCMTVHVEATAGRLCSTGGASASPPITLLVVGENCKPEKWLEIGVLRNIADCE